MQNSIICNTVSVKSDLEKLKPAYTTSYYRYIPNGNESHMHRYFRICTHSVTQLLQTYRVCSYHSLPNYDRNNEIKANFASKKFAFLEFQKHHW